MNRQPPLHPVLFAAFPILFLYAQNIQGDVSPRDLVLPLLASILGTLVIWILLWLGFGDVHRAGLATSLVVILVFSFGHVATWMDPLREGASETLLLGAWVLLPVAGVLALVRPREGFRSATGVLNVVAGFLCLVNLVPIVGFELGTAEERLPTTITPVLDVGQPSGPDRDIYYLIFDRYAADRTLRDLYGFDNSDFYGSLEEMGFYFAHESLANYPKTVHSLASSLNMTYLDALATEVGRDAADWEPLTDALSGSVVARTLQRAGYRYEHIGSWWSPTASDPVADESFVFDAPARFRDVLFESTVFPTIARVLGISGESFQMRQYRRVLFQFDTLEEISRDPEPTFTFAHFTLPHPPYVFDADGDFVTTSEVAQQTRAEAYLAQLRFTNSKIEELVLELLRGPDEEDPIIVLQSDEGPHPIRLVHDDDGFVWPEATDAELGEKLRILDAYFLPGLEETGLYPTISPVNTFRLIFSDYFGADLPLLPDETYVFERNAYPYRFTNVTERLRG